MKVRNSFAALKLKVLKSVRERRALQKQGREMIAIKEGASIRGLGVEMLFATLIVEQVLKENGSPCIITSGTDGEHSRGSEHYKGDAMDYRIWYLRKDQLEQVVLVMKKRLGSDFDVVLEPTHIHVEFDPKTPV